MTDKEFWEDDPQLYWSYHIFYQKKMEMEREQIKYNCWLQGNLNCMAQTIAIANSFGKDNEKVEFPDFDKLFNNKAEQKEKTPEEIDNYVRELNNAWARF
jgi:hypothetical protein